MLGLCLRSRDRTLLRCMWDGVGFVLDCVLVWEGGRGGCEQVTRVYCSSLCVDRCVHS